MSRHQSSDALLEIKNAYYIGNYQFCITEAQNANINDSDVKLEIDSYLYRSYIALQRYTIVRNELKANCHPYLEPLKLLVDYYLAQDKNVIVQKMDDILSKDVKTSSNLLFITAAIIYYHELNYESALQILHQGDNLECSALSLQIYLKMDRIDLARKELKNMQDKDEDAILTQLSQAWVNIAMGGEKLDDAFYIFQEIIDKHGSTPLLLNGQAVCFIHQEKFEEAESALQQSISKDSDNSDSLINLIVLSRLSGKPQEVAKRYLTHIQDSHKSHTYVKEYSVKESEFDKLVLQYSCA
ncbi:Coatomer subunit epsilon, putative [Pediculus humanus corporis]|uniref:Coatomer subunit epsilon n=1 Tax=Pediculus humanus subsp. corporis TaxID=121224 RepID=E0VMC8_PEDHC|nr:Coatomer subunit epsilon, putative [Pediculus humanus corporis]EEB14534.1 Coatomer subunit epsilon, putative [Pediculus humanus corporis]